MVLRTSDMEFYVNKPTSKLALAPIQDSTHTWDEKSKTHHVRSTSRDDSGLSSAPLNFRRVRSNSTGTLYVNQTMRAPDRDGTITCVCTVFRAHMLAAHSEDGGKHVAPIPTPKDSRFATFDDVNSEIVMQHV